MDKLTGVGAIICCSHTDAKGAVHGHTYEVIAWHSYDPSTDGDALWLQQQLTAVCDEFDHTHLKPEHARAEDLAAVIHRMLWTTCVAVEINRKDERLYAKFVV